MKSVQSKLFSILIIFTLVMAACGADEPEATVITQDDVIVAEGAPEGAVTPLTEDVVVQEQATPTAEGAVIQEQVVTPAAPAAEAQPQVTPAPATDPGGEPAVAVEEVMLKASTLLDFNVSNLQGEDLGVVSDLVIDTNTGLIPYAILSSSGFLGFGGENVLVPFSAFSLSQTGTELLLPFASADQIQNAPTVGDDWPTWGDAAWGDQGAAAWGQTEFGQGLPAVGQSTNALRVSNLMGYGVGAHGELGNGSIMDLLVDLQTNRAKWLVVDYAGAATTTGAVTSVDYANHLVLVPFGAMDWPNLGQEIGLSPTIDPAALAGAPLVERVELEQAEFLNPNFDTEVVSYWEGYGHQFQ
ncbi:MAG: PRC-barrel domain-containing protein [Caldilineaceae bacterium]|nr:PRC-barrel domain-containing protein [Caldilineaceae bacterium]